VACRLHAQKYGNDEGNGYINTLLCFMQLFIVSNHTKTWYFANNNIQHFDFDADEKFLPNRLTAK
jgi:type I restriction enzyme R subunit